MLTEFYVIAALFVLGLLSFVFLYFAPAYRKQRGTRVIVCPETKKPASVEVDAKRAALTSITARPSDSPERVCRT